jgi:hypothetical protein
LFFDVSNNLESLKFNPHNCVIIVDFTKFTIVDDGSIQCFVISVLSQGEVIDGVEWKPHILYYDFLAQNEKKKKITVKQTFPYVKVSELPQL